jgi:uncharacterized protein YcbX
LDRPGPSAGGGPGADSCVIDPVDSIHMHPVGTIAAIRRYPVKSMLGEALQRTLVHTTGLWGDRVCALIDRETGRVATAKRPHRWRAMLTLRAHCHERVDGVDVRIVLPDGRELDAGSAETSRILSELLGREVVAQLSRPGGLELERSNPDEVAARGVDAIVEAAVIPLGGAAPDGGFFDYAPVHFIATSSLARVAAASPSGLAEPVRFRPNFVIDTPRHEPFVENGWVGGTLEVGPEVLLEVLLPTPRCAVPTLAHGNSPADAQLTRRIGTLNQVEVLDMGPLACLGAYARVLRAGAVSVGDPVSWHPAPA